MKAIKAWGQHFLTDPAIAARIVAEAGIEPGEEVWEIGPGTGILSQELISAGARLTAFELDKRFAQVLKDRFRDALHLVLQDILTVDWSMTLEGFPGTLKLVANIPYQITSPLLGKLEQWHHKFSRCVIMVQKEVAERLGAVPGTKAYGVMTLRLKRVFDVQTLFEVGRENFDPIPKVDSAVISLSPRLNPPAISDEKKYLALINLDFAHRRKTLRNNLAARLDKTHLSVLESRSGIDLDRRGETLCEEEFILLSSLL